MPMLYENDLFCGWQPESFRAAGGEDPRFDVKSIALSCCRNDWAGASIPAARSSSTEAPASSFFIITLSISTWLNSSVPMSDRIATTCGQGMQ